MESDLLFPLAYAELITPSRLLIGDQPVPISPTIQPVPISLTDQPPPMSPSDDTPVILNKKRAMDIVINVFFI